MPPLAIAPPGVAPGEMASGPVANPIFVAVNSGNPESDLFVSERAADVMAKYNFEIDTTNQLEGTIATQYKVGSGILEPWHRESVGLENRLESTFQPIRRKVLVHFVRVEGGYLVSVEALKEIEDLTSPTPNSPGGSTFPQNYPLRRDLNLVLGQASPSGWIPSAATRRSNRTCSAGCRPPMRSADARPLARRTRAGLRNGLPG